jgi:hypothetical protein
LLFYRRDQASCKQSDAASGCNPNINDRTTGVPMISHTTCMRIQKDACASYAIARCNMALAFRIDPGMRALQ